MATREGRPAVNQAASNPTDTSTVRPATRNRGNGKPRRIFRWDDHSLAQAACQECDWRIVDRDPASLSKIRRRGREHADRYRHRVTYVKLTALELRPARWPG